MNTESTSFIIAGFNWRENKRKQKEEKFAKELEKQEQKSAKILESQDGRKQEEDIKK